jgi:hypothetical protein
MIRYNVLILVGFWITVLVWDMMPKKDPQCTLKIGTTLVQGEAIYE